LASVDFKEPSTVQTTRSITVEIEGEDKLALAADWLTRVIFG
jgi:acyl dehydratase